MATQVFATMRYVEGPYYADWPECLPKYRWLVESGLKNATSMFNEPAGGESRTRVICKVCGGKTRNTRSEMAAHVHEHAGQLNLTLSAKKPVLSGEQLAGLEAHSPGADDLGTWEEQLPLFNDIASTVMDAIEGRSASEDGVLGFDESHEELSKLLASVIVASSEEHDVGSAVFCTDCTES